MSHYDKNEGEERLRLAVSAGRMGTWDRNFLSGQLNWSVECKAMFGLAPETEMNDERFMQAIHPEDRAPTDLAVREALEKQTDFNSEYRVIWPDGTIHWIAAVGHGYYNEAGQAIRMSGVTLDITERKRAEEILQESEGRFRSLFENMLNGFAYCKMLFDGDRPQDFIYLNVNRAFETQTGLKDVVGKKVSEVIPGILESSRDLIALYGRVALTGKPEVTETYVASLNMWFSISAYSPQKEYFVAIFDVITERKQAEEELKESEERWRRAIVDSPIPIMIHDEDDRVLQLSAGWTKFSGYDIDDIPTLADWTERAYGERSGFKKDYIDQLFFINQTVQNGEWIVTAKDGSKRIWDFQTTPLGKGSQGRRVLHSMAIDITERKQAEAAQQQSEILFRTLFELSPDAVVLLDPHDPNISSPIVDCNAAACLMNGYDREELIGRSIDIVNADPYTQAGQAAYLEKLRDEGTLKYEVFHRRKNGVIFPVEISTAIIKVGERELVIGIDRDITERKRIEESLQEYNTRLETEVEQRTRELRDAQEQLVRQERLAMLGQLAGSIGHELRNPLGVISNAVYFLKLSQPDASDIVKEYLGIIEKETRTSDKIVTDLLDFTRIKSLDRQPASVSELIRQTLERHPAPPSIDVAVEIPADLPQIYADPLHVIQVLVNLVSNACQAMGVTTDGQLKVSAAAQGAMIKIDVQDTGVGIPPENMKKIFEPLFTTNTKGIGLGLAVSRKLTEANGGRIEAQSETGKGSTFTVYLPVYKESK